MHALARAAEREAEDTARRGMDLCDTLGDGVATLEREKTPMGTKGPPHGTAHKLPAGTPFEIDGVPLEEGGESVDGMQDASDSTGVGYRLGFQYFGECDACGTVPIWIDGAIVTPIYCNCGRLIITVRRRAK